MANFIFLLIVLNLLFAWLYVTTWGRLDKTKEAVKQIVSDMESGRDRTRQSITDKLKSLL